MSEKFCCSLLAAGDWWKAGTKPLSGGSHNLSDLFKGHWYSSYSSANKSAALILYRLLFFTTHQLEHQLVTCLILVSPHLSEGYCYLLGMAVTDKTKKQTNKYFFHKLPNVQLGIIVT